MTAQYDSLLIVSFGGPEGPDDVMPFLENVLRGKNVPRTRMLEVAQHYQHFGGVSPINAQNRALIAAVKNELARHGPDLPIYWGNRNWHPMLADTFRDMKRDGMQNALAFFTSAYSSYSGCRQYREDIQRAQQEVGGDAPRVDKLRAYFNHPGFIETMVHRVREGLTGIPEDLHSATEIIYSAHSIPMAMASGCQYVAQLTETCKLVSASFPNNRWKLTYQSRSGPPTQPWLEPDVCDYLKFDKNGKNRAAIIVPIGFISDHMEVLFDLDTEARELCDDLGITMVRAKTAGTHPRFVQMIRELICERTGGAERLALGDLGPSHDVCPEDCCPSGRPNTAAKGVAQR